MKQAIIIGVASLLGSSVFAQTAFQQKLISDITSITEEINFNPEGLYPERSKAIFTLNATRPNQEWVPFTLADAINDVNCAIEINPGDASLYSLRAEYKRDIYGDYSGAVKDMNRAIQLEPGNAQWYLQRANYRHYSKGCHDYKQCADLHDKRCIEIVDCLCTDLLSMR